ncbi:alpha/beta hydrolase [Coleofasciculus sp. FACHB-501]|uniref:alpha/beta fold hydrolase n=1 Tax=Cyanophyceae TaxID=3028117 RepID=UPI001687DFF8|nr:alpha/beta hydrolase [Coleofasciculus sp. FACHB-501]MBD1840081.1 alpha/beta hydrolase [Coleofasciculus sp. FACHB-501]
MDLHYEVQGKGEAVVLIHNAMADLRDWELIAPQLAQTYQVITFDGRGAGQSPPLLEPAHYVEDLRQLLDHLNLDRVILVGHSIGGQIATDFALAYPDRVTRLVLIAPGLSGFQFSPDVQQWYAQINVVAPDLEKMVEVLLNHPVYSVVMSSPQRDRIIEMTTHNMKRSFEWKTYEMLWAQPPTIDRLSELQTKTLFIIGKKDMPDLFKVAELFQQVPDIRFAYIEGADHMPTLTHADEVSRLIIQFLSQ